MGIPSLPSWERGLKYTTFCDVLHKDKVAPFVGAWIEIMMPTDVAIAMMSLPSWERGLK